MNIKSRQLPRAVALAMSVVLSLTPVTAEACSRAVYLGPDGQIVTGRTMDWLEGMHTNLWVFPPWDVAERGPRREGLRLDQ